MSEATTHLAYVRLCSKKDGHPFVDPALRPRLVADAREQNTNLTEVALSIIARRLNVPYVPSGRSTEPKPNENLLILRLPLTLYQALQSYASVNGKQYQDVIRLLLSAHYGLRVPAKPLRTRNRTPKITA